MNFRGILFIVLGCGISLILMAAGAYRVANDAMVDTQEKTSSGIQVVIGVQDDDVVLRWDSMDSHSLVPVSYHIYRNVTPEFGLDAAHLIATVTGTSYRDIDILQHYDRCFYCIEAIEPILPEPLFNPPYTGPVIEDFESGAVVLFSYQDEDEEPEAWEVQSSVTYDSSWFALALYGNTWKELFLDSSFTLTHQTIWQAAFWSDQEGEIHALGIGDTTRMLFYVVRGDQILTFPIYNTTYQNTLNDSQWRPYLFPIGNDWHTQFGDYPTITRLVFVNDNDSPGSNGRTYFDEILDVTGTVPRPPQVHIVAMQNPSTLSGPWIIGTGHQVNIGFIGRVFDPDGDVEEILWDFGDGATSSQLTVSHTFPRYPNITVSLTATDAWGLTGSQSVSLTFSEPNVSGDVSMAFVGDVMIARRYESSGFIEAYGANHIFHRVRDLLHAVDVAVCTLECPFPLADTPHPTKEYIFKGRPEYVSALDYAGYDMVILANNHVWDYLDAGMLETIEVLDSVGILRTGAGINNILARQPTYITRNGVRIALLGFCNRTGRADNELPYLEAGLSKGGLAMLNYENLGDMIPYAREHSDRVVVYYHSGEEYMTEPPEDDYDRNGNLRPAHERIFTYPTSPTDQEQELREYAIDLGADMVINSHPHVLQGFQVYNGKLIAHSLGNFAFDQYFWQTFPSAMVETNFDHQNPITDIDIRPIYIDDYVPKPATGQLGTRILERLMDYSRALNTTLVLSLDDSLVRKVAIDTTQIQNTITQHQVTVTMRQETPGLYVSEPLSLIDNGASPSVIQSVTHQGSPLPCSLALGREML